ncbi:RNA/RNP complex-1-interacting phosphatase-like isoform X2 [Zophobas morio]|uniref:RNA/RNP complex-1-interacting phosphatase-like isoform X2 n=1 Tax=Zophobas morio TaxID=2755281 RepID=UPI0030833981
MTNKKRGIPERWEKYLPMGRPIDGTRFLPFKAPLKPELCKSQPESEWFTPNTLLENTPMLRAVIDLTNTNRYYNSEEFTNKGVLYKKINIFGGGRVPPRKVRDEFFEAVDQLRRTLDHDSEFQEARGYPIERENYVSDIMSEIPSTSWRTEPRVPHYFSRSDRFRTRNKHLSHLRFGEYGQYSRHSRRTVYKH